MCKRFETACSARTPRQAVGPYGGCDCARHTPGTAAGAGSNYGLEDQRGSTDRKVREKWQTNPRTIH